MNVFITGGKGNIGQEVALNLIRHKEVETIVLGDTSADPAGLRDRFRKNKKIFLVEVDANDPKRLAGLLKGTDVVVNCAGPFHSTALNVVQAAVEARVNYIDVCDDYEATRALFASEYGQAAKDAGITVLTGMGSDPGTNNVIAKWYADKLDRVDEISLFWAVSIAEIAGAAWEHSLHMTMGRIPQFLDGRIKYVEGGSGEQMVEFPEPIGPCRVRYVGHPQPLTMPRYIQGVKQVIVKGALFPGWVDELIREQKLTGLLSKLPVRVGGIEVAPCDLALRLWEAIPINRDKGPSCSGLKVTVKGERDGKQVIYTADMVGGMGPGTGLPASIAVRMLGAGDIRFKGISAPEGCVDPGKFLAAMVQCGASIHQTETVISMLEVQQTFCS